MKSHLKNLCLGVCYLKDLDYVILYYLTHMILTWCSVFFPLY